MNESQRIELFLKHKGLKKNSLAKSLGYKNGTVFYHINSSRNGISADLAKRIAEVYPEVNQNWFLTGKGKMLLSTLRIIEFLGKDPVADKILYNMINFASKND